MRRWVLLSLLIAGSVAAEVRFGPERFISAPKIGYRGEVDTVIVTASDSQFLVTWREDRPVTDTSYYVKGLAMRVDLAGHPVDPLPIPLPFPAKAVVWTGNEWLLLGSSAARMNRDGQIIGAPVQLWDDSLDYDYGIRAVWTGNALIIGVTESSRHRLVTRSFDAQFNLIEEKVHFESEGYISLDGFASDGVTAMMLYQGGAYTGGKSGAAVFSRDGYLLHTVLVPPFQIFYKTLAASPAGYLVMGHAGNTNRGVLIDTNGVIRAEVPKFGTQASSFGSRLWWDGSQFSYVYDEGAYATTLYETSISAAGVVGAIRQVKNVPSSPRLSVANLGRTTAIGYSLEYPSKRLLQVRVAPDVASLEKAPAVSSPVSAEPRETPAAASSASQVLVAWRQRLAPGDALDVYAARVDFDGDPLDPNAVHIGASSCSGLPPAIASDGRDFLVAWRGNAFVQGVIMRGDGSNTLPANVGRLGACTEGGVSVASNGSGYLVTWSEPHPTTKRATVYAARVDPNGKVLDSTALQVGETAYPNNTSTRVHVASNGSDYLVAWETFAVRVTSAGAVLDKTKPLPLGTAEAAAAWFNGRTYVVVTSAYPQLRFLRIGSDGSGAQTFNAPPPQSFGLPDYTSSDLKPACGARGCFFWWGVTNPPLVHVADDGQTFALTMDSANVLNDEHGRILVQGSRLMSIHSFLRTDQPWSYSMDILLRVMSGGKPRVVRH